MINSTDTTVLSKRQGALGARSDVSSLVLVLFAVSILLFPVGTLGNVGAYSYIAIVICISAVFWGIRPVAWVFVSLLVFVGLFVIEILTNGLAWSTREYIFSILWVILLIKLPVVNEKIAIRTLVALLGIIVVLDFLLLYLKVIPWLEHEIKNVFYRRGMNDYFLSYWRHVGIGGNPNSSAFIYGAYLVVFSLIASIGKSLVSRKFLLIGSAIAIVAITLLIETESRSNIIATAVIVVIGGLLAPGQKRWPYLLVGLFAVVVLIQPEVSNKLADRFINLSSGHARVELWAFLLTNMDAFDFFVGKPLESLFVDSDFIFIFVRFGLVGIGLLLVFLFFVFRETWKPGIYPVFVRYIYLYALVSGLAVGVFVSPNIAGFLFLIAACLWNLPDSSSHLAGEHQSSSGKDPDTVFVRESGVLSG